MMLLNCGAIFFYLILFCHLNANSEEICEIDEWQCDNSDCIPQNNRCDGMKHCADGSDEIPDYCIQNTCENMFRCSYGACIPENKKCDGTKDCTDGSDEIPEICTKDPLDINRRWKTNCESPYEFRCENSGECIESYHRCDGAVDCKDGSDETDKTCGFIFCPNFAFRCAYGACIPGDAKCNKINDCVDNSDEATELCNYPRKFSGNGTIYKENSNEMKDCFAAYKRSNLIIEDAETHKRYEHNDRIPFGSTVNFKCLHNWHLQGNGELKCLNATWYQSWPTCTKPANLAPCKALDFQCNSGTCIDDSKLCDGARDCDDGSDETVASCMHRECSSNHFRCEYGGCISKTSLCDTHPDCADGSDESQWLCEQDKLPLLNKLRGNCSSEYDMQCKSGECIGLENRCDGVRDCRDGYDETVELCSGIFCPHFAFRCGYGGCVKGTAKCDLYCDCADCSDESALLCDYKTDDPPPRKEEEQLCRLPSKLDHLLVDNAETGAPLFSGTTVPSGTAVNYVCEKSWQRVGSTAKNTCVNGHWLYKFPTCTKYCKNSTVKSSLSMQVTCFVEGTQVNCSSSSLPIGTEAKLACSPGYVLPPHSPDTPQTIMCDEDGEWNYSKFKCLPECVPPRKSQEPSSTYHVNIFQRITEDKFNPNPICHGAIISPILMITAMTCFSKSGNFKVANDPKLYAVVIGDKYIKKGNFHEVKEIMQFGKRSSKQSTEDYDFDVRTFDEPRIQNMADIAILELKSPIHYSQTVRPICLYFSPDISTPPQVDYEKQLYTMGAVFEDKQKKLVIAGMEINQETLLINVEYYKGNINSAIDRLKYIL